MSTINIDNIFNIDVSQIEEIRINQPKKEEILEKIVNNSIKSEPKKFEIEALNFLFSNKKSLSIENVYKHTKSHIDCSITLENGNSYIVEFKYWLNWMKMCNAIVEFQRYLNDIDNKPKGGIIIFNDFCSDWDKKTKSRLYANGWYRSHEDIKSFEKSFKIRVLQLKDSRFTAPFYNI